MHLPRNKRTRFTIALSTALLIAGAIAFGVAVRADPPESGPAVDSHSEHADIWSSQRSDPGADAADPERGRP